MKTREALAQILGFDNLGFDNQMVIFNKARMFGWTGEHPGSNLDTDHANKQVDDAIDYLLQQGVVFKKENGGKS